MLVSKHEDLSSDPCHPCKTLVTVVHAYYRDTAVCDEGVLGGGSGRCWGFTSCQQTSVKLANTEFGERSPSEGNMERIKEDHP